MFDFPLLNNVPISFLKLSIPLLNNLFVFFVNRYISLIEVKNIHSKHPLIEHRCKFEIDEITYPSRSLEQKMTLARIRLNVRARIFKFDWRVKTEFCSIRNKNALFYSSIWILTIYCFKSQFVSSVQVFHIPKWLLLLQILVIPFSECRYVSIFDDSTLLIIHAA